MATDFHKVINVYDTRLAQPLTALPTDTDLYVTPGTGNTLASVIPCILTLTTGYGLNELKQAERVEVTAQDPMDPDHFTIVREFDALVPGTEIRSHDVGEYVANFIAAYQFTELQNAVNALENDPLPDDLSARTMTLTNHLVVGPVHAPLIAVGAIRYEGGHFQGCTSVSPETWVDLDESGGSGWTPPAGTDGQILVYDTDDWYASSKIIVTDDETKINAGYLNYFFSDSGATLPGTTEMEDATSDSLTSTEIYGELVRGQVLSATGFTTLASSDNPQLLMGTDIYGMFAPINSNLIMSMDTIDLGAVTGTFANLFI